METPYEVAPDITILPLNLPIPGMGFLPINSFVIKAKEPVLIDFSVGLEKAAYMKALESVIDPKDLKWLWLTHDDSDHTGSIQEVLEAAPNARLVANGLAVMRMGASWQVPMQRCYFINPGESIDVGDRTLTALRPPLFDNPTSTAAYDSKSGALFSADCFGGIIGAPAQDAADIPAPDLEMGMCGWAVADSPWIHIADPDKFNQTLDPIRKLDPKIILSGHLPPAIGRSKQLIDTLAKTPTIEPFVAPNQEALEQMLAMMGAGGPPTDG